MEATKKREKPEAIELLKELWPVMDKEERSWLNGWANAMALHRMFNKPAKEATV